MFCGWVLLRSWSEIPLNYTWADSHERKDLQLNRKLTTSHYLRPNLLFSPLTLNNQQEQFCFSIWNYALFLQTIYPFNRFESLILQLLFILKMLLFCTLFNLLFLIHKQYTQINSCKLRCSHQARSSPIPYPQTIFEWFAWLWFMLGWVSD